MALRARLFQEVAYREACRHGPAVGRYFELQRLVGLERLQERVDLDGRDVLERLPVRVRVDYRAGYEKSLHCFLLTGFTRPAQALVQVPAQGQASGLSLPAPRSNERSRMDESQFQASSLSSSRLLGK